MRSPLALAPCLWHLVAITAVLFRLLVNWSSLYSSPTALTSGGHRHTYIRFASGQYASYWNAFLCYNIYCNAKHINKFYHKSKRKFKQTPLIFKDYLKLDAWSLCIFVHFTSRSTHQLYRIFLHHRNICTSPFTSMLWTECEVKEADFTHWERRLR